jgi:hypothetical protein
LTIEELLEIEEIKKLRIMYSHYLDSGDVDSLTALFCEDAVCEFGESYGGDWIGREVIHENYSRFATDEIKPFSFAHAVTNPWIRVLSDTRANGRWYFLDLNLMSGTENPLKLFGINDDVYQKVDDHWLIERTRIDFVWPKREYQGLRDLS